MASGTEPLPGLWLVAGRTEIIHGIPFNNATCQVDQLVRETPSRTNYRIGESERISVQPRPVGSTPTPIVMLEHYWNVVKFKLDDSELLDRFVKRNSFEMKLERQALIDELNELIVELKRS